MPHFNFRCFLALSLQTNDQIKRSSIQFNGEIKKSNIFEMIKNMGCPAWQICKKMWNLLRQCKYYPTENLLPSRASSELEKTERASANKGYRSL